MLQVGYIMIYIIHKIYILLKITRILKLFLRSIKMNSSRLEKDKNIEDNKTGDVINIFRLKKETNDTTVKDTKNLFILKKEIESVKDRRIRDIRNLFEYEEKYYYKPITVDNFCSNNYIEYESKGDRNKNKIS